MKTVLTFLICSIFYLSISAQNKPDPTYQVVEDMPRFPGCEDETIAHRSDCANKKLLQFVYSNLKYPEEAKKRKTEGTVIIQFVIDKEGNVTSPKIIDGIGDGCDEEAFRVVNEMPDWIPGYQRGKPVKVRYTLPVKFKL